MSPASNIFALFHLKNPSPPGVPANNSLTIDDRTSTHAAGTYDFFSTLGSISGPGGTTGGINFTSFGPINSFLVEGGPAANTFDIHSTFNATIASTTIVGGANDDTANVLGDTFPGIGTPLTINLEGGTNIVNVGNGNTGATISSTVQVTDPTTLNINDTADTTHSTATLDDLSGNPAAPFQVTGLGRGHPVRHRRDRPQHQRRHLRGCRRHLQHQQHPSRHDHHDQRRAEPELLNLSNAGHTISPTLPGPVVVNGNGGTNSADALRPERRPVGDVRHRRHDRRRAGFRRPDLRHTSPT